MKIAVATDIHNNRVGVDRFLEEAGREKVDLILFLGDFITFHPESFIFETLTKAAQVGLTYAVPGNCETPAFLNGIEETGAHSLHESKVEMDGFKLIGYGRSQPCPTPTPGEMPISEFGNGLESLLEPGAVWVFHNPVYGYRDYIPKVGNVGSKRLRDLMERYKPRLVLSGHIHEAVGVDVYNSTYLVNPGALVDGRFGIVNINGRKTVINLIED